MNLQISPPSKSVLKSWHVLCLGSALGVLGVHLQIFRLNYAKNLFSALGVHPPATIMLLPSWAPPSPVGAFGLVCAGTSRLISKLRCGSSTPRRILKIELSELSGTRVALRCELQLIIDAALSHTQHIEPHAHSTRQLIILCHHFH